MPFRMNWAQEQLFSDLHYLSLILKARQLGFTTFIQLIMLDACVFNSNVRAATVAHTQPVAQSIFADKVKFPYDELPDELRAAVPAQIDSANELSFANNSSLRVATALRSGTYQYLHISEHGKLCAQYPDKAKEVRTGALNTVDAGQMVFIESTAEGHEGDFYDFCQKAQARARLDAPLTALDFKFFFFPWWQEPTYRIEPEGVVITAEYEEYFDKLDEDEGIELDAAQKAWYVKKADIQQEDMKREYPSTPKEAFEASVEGAYYGRQMAKAEREKRITAVPYEEGLPVHTYWDLGMDDETVIWFVQFAGPRIQIIDYYANSGEGMAHYIGVLRAKPYVYGEHWAPHDIKVRELGPGLTRREQARKLGVKFRIIPKASVQDGINAVRAIFAKCWFDEVRAATGVGHLKAYRKEWDEKAGCWKDKPRHGPESHAADGFRGLAISYKEKMGEPVNTEIETRQPTFREAVKMARDRRERRRRI